MNLKIWLSVPKQEASFRTSLYSSLSLLILEDLPVAAELPPHLLHQDMIMLEDDKLSVIARLPALTNQSQLMLQDCNDLLMTL